MATITEDYVSYEIAKLLKEKGFDERTIYHYTNTDTLQHQITYNQYKNSEMGNAYSAPTHQMAMKWLREEKNIIINMWYNGVDWDAEHYNNEDENFYLITNYSCNSYEEAVEAALKYCLENLI